MDGQEVTVDLEACTVCAGGEKFAFEIDDFARYCLLHGMDRLDFLLAEAPAIEHYEVSHER